MIDAIRAHLWAGRRQRFDVRAAVELSRLGLPFTPWPGSALAPSALLTIINDLVINRRRTVVELGAGISTVYLAKILQQRGGRLISIEHDADWAGIVRQMIATAEVSESVQLVHAPLEDSQSRMNDTAWYSEQVVARSLEGHRIDALIVDGPPAYLPGQHLARLPALPMLKDYLSERCAIFLDDIIRPGEQAIAKKWSELLGIRFAKHYSTCGLAVACRGQAFHSLL